MLKKHILWQKENTNEFTVDISCAWKVIKFISVFCMCLVMFIGCGEAELDEKDPISGNLSNLDDTEPNLDDTKLNLDDQNIRAQIFSQAIEYRNLQTRQEQSGEKLFYAPNQQLPYTGWVKGANIENDLELWQMQRGKNHGIYIKWSKFGYTHNSVKGIFENGQANGLWTYYHWTEKGDKKNAEGFYKAGTKDGIWTHWYKNGQKESEGAFKAGSKDGVWTYWYSNGQKNSEGMFIAGSKEGLWNYWNEEGFKYKELIQERVKDIAFSPDGRTLAANFGWDENIWLWDVETGTLKHTFEGHNESGASYHTYGRSIAFSPDGRFLANGVRFDGLVKIWNVETGMLAKTFDANFGIVEFSPNGHYFAVCDGRYVEVYGNETWEHVDTMIQEYGINSIAFSPVGRKLASGRSGKWITTPTVEFPHRWELPAWDPGEIYLWNINWRPKESFPKQPGSNVSIVAFSPDGNTLVSVHWKPDKWRGRISKENAVHFWDVETKELKNSWIGTPNIDSIAFSPDGSAFATVGKAVNVYHWDGDIVSYKYTLKGHLDDINSIAFSPDGSTLASSSDDGTIRIWEVQ